MKATGLRIWRPIYAGMHKIGKNPLYNLTYVSN